MTRYGNLKAGPDGKMTADDERCWRDLISAAKAASTSLARAPVPALSKVAKAAKNACAPGVVTRSNPCVVLSRMSRRYCDETAAGRAGLQASLGEAAEAAEEALNAGGRRARKDIDG